MKSNMKRERDSLIPKKVTCGSFIFDPDCPVSRSRHRQIHKGCKQARKQRCGRKTDMPVKGKALEQWIRDRERIRKQEYRAKKRAVPETITAVPDTITVVPETITAVTE